MGWALGRSSSRRCLAVALATVIAGAACSEAAEPEASPGTSGATTASEPTIAVSPVTTAAPSVSPEDTTLTTENEPSDDGSVVSAFRGEPWFLGEVPAAAEAADPDAEPIKIGMINQENTPLGSFPELRGAVQAAAAWVNAELGGVEGRPIEIVPCITSFSVEQSQACAQDMVQAGVVAVVGGIDVTSNGSIPVLQQNGIPAIGGIPANLVEQQSATNFYFSGGTAGGMAAMLAHAAQHGATSVMIAYGEFESFTVTARDFAAAVGESLGLRVELQPFPIVGADMLQVLTAATNAEVDALIVAAADTACVPVMEGAVQLGLTAQIYLVGACAATTILEAAGDAAKGVIFSSEGPSDVDVIEGDIFNAVVDRYAVEPAGAAGTVGFRGFMNLYSLLVELGPDNIDSAAITALVSDAVDRPSFWGHSYTCDGERIPGLPALCAPEQSLFTTTGVPGDPFVFLPEGFEATGGWIETDDLYAAALG